jgi:hypothetical protein
MAVTRPRAVLLAATLAGAASLAAAPPPAGFVSDTPLPAAKPWTAQPRSSEGPLRFAVIGDRTGVARPGVFPQAMTQIGWLAPDFIIDVGDMIEGYTDDRAELNREWDEIDGYVKAAGVPFVFTPGNHDLDNPTMLDVWRQRHGAEFYDFTYKHALFLVLDTEDPPTPMSPTMAGQFHGLVKLMQANPAAADKMMADYYSGALKAPPRDPAEVQSEARIEKDANFSDRQVAFVKAALARHPDVRWTFVFFHKPAWTDDSPAWPKIEALLGARNYTVFAGHMHYFTHEVRGGHDYFDMATTGAIQHKPGPGNMDHVMFVTLTPEGPKYANIRLNGLMDADGHTGQTRAF